MRNFKRTWCILGKCWWEKIICKVLAQGNTNAIILTNESKPEFKVEKTLLEDFPSIDKLLDALAGQTRTTLKKVREDFIKNFPSQKKGRVWVLIDPPEEGTPFSTINKTTFGLGLDTFLELTGNKNEPY